MHALRVAEQKDGRNLGPCDVTKPPVDQHWSCPSSGLLLWFNPLWVGVFVVSSRQIPK